MTANFDENLPSSECQLKSVIQEPSRRTEKRRIKTSRSRRSQRMGGRKNIEQEKSEGSSKISSKVEGIYGET